MAHLHITLEDDLISYVKSTAAWSRPRLTASAFIAALVQAHRAGTDPETFSGSDQAIRSGEPGRAQQPPPPPTPVLAHRTNVLSRAGDRAERNRGTRKNSAKLSRARETASEAVGRSSRTESVPAPGRTHNCK